MVNIQEIEIKMESLINDISRDYNEDNIIDKIDHVVDVHENSDCNANHDLMRITKKYNIPYDELSDSRIIQRRRLAKEYSLDIINREKHALIDHILNHIHSENHESNDAQKIIEEGRFEVSPFGNMSCIIFCHRNICDELKSKNSHDSSFKFIPSEKLSQQIVCVGNNAIVWARCAPFALNVLSNIEFEIGTVSRCQIIDAECIRVYDLQNIQY